jgi:endonuclease G, mitochondrial
MMSRCEFFCRFTGKTTKLFGRLKKMTRLERQRDFRLEKAVEAARRWEETKEQRAEVLVAVAKGGPKAAESPERTTRFNAREARRAIIGSPPRRPIGSERILDTNDLRDYPRDEQGLRAGQPIARLIDEFRPGIVSEGFGTGFLVSPRLLLSNHHVFPDRGSARACAHFGYERDRGALRQGVVFELDPDVLFLNDERLDFSLVAVKPRSGDGQALRQFGCHPLIATTGKILQGHPVIIIQHPMGGHKQWCENENRLLLLPADQPFMQYSTDTMPGSSGSPVFNSFWEVVGLHHSGVPRLENGKIMRVDGRPWNEHTDTEEEIHWIANEGTRVSELVKFLRNAVQFMEGVEAALLSELLALTEDPLKRDSLSNAIREAETMSSANNGFGGSSAGSTPMSITINGTANFYINQGAAATPRVDSTPVLNATTALVEEKSIRFDPDYDSRGGYDPDFLDGFSIPLPGVTDERDPELFKENGEPLELKYHHFSVVMNKKRLLQMWSAVNVDYDPAMRPISGRDAFGKDRWKPDPRIPVKFQLENDEFYAPAKKFDRGHMVRREDNAWGGTVRMTEFANADTFHWTNCTPQHESFNQAGSDREPLLGLWGKLENHIQKQATSGDTKLTILSGPVLAEDDLEHDFGAGLVKVPVRFWKVIAARERKADGTFGLAVFGFLLDQTDTIRRKGLEAFRAGKFAPFQVSLAKITELSGVTFDQVLTSNDVRKGGDPVRIDALPDVVTERARSAGGD